MTDKEALRKKMMAIRREFVGLPKKNADELIAARVLARDELTSAQRICVYESLPEEVDTKKIIAMLRGLKKIVVLPEPNPTEVDLFIVPGVAFDYSCNRLGRGGGHYDKLLADVHIPCIGVAYACQIVPRLPIGQYDIPMNTVITEKEIYEQTQTL